jgi:gliding motility-associated lipoprotein GldD
MKILTRIKYTPLFLFLILCGCRHTVVPKPKGFFRIDLPEKKYVLFEPEPDLPVSFEYPAYGKLAFNQEYAIESGWFNIEFPSYRAKIYLTYKHIKDNFPVLMEETYKMNVKNHIFKADAINEKEFSNKENNVYGILYDLKGNTASAVQFYATDSTRNYLRGSLYFAAEPDADSLAPVIDFFRKDIVHIIETLKWKM